MSELSNEAFELRKQMEHIRCELAGDVQDLAGDAKTLTDYRYHVRQHPWSALAAAAAVGYMLIPNRTHKLVPDAKDLRKLIKDNQLVVQTKSEINQKKGLFAMAVSMAAAAAMRSAIGYASEALSAKAASNKSPISPRDEVLTPQKPR